MVTIKRYCESNILEISNGRIKEYCGNYLYEINGFVTNQELMAILTLLFL